MSSWLEKTTSWSAHPAWYDYIHEIRVEDMTICSGGGQVITLYCSFEWEIKILHQTEEYEWGILQMKLFPNRTKRVIGVPTETWQHQLHAVQYRITRGQFIFEQEMNPFGRQVFQFKLEFRQSPFPLQLTTTLFNLVEEVDQQSESVFYGGLDKERSTQLTKEQLPLKAAHRKLPLELKRIAWKSKRQIMRKSKMATIWLDNLSQEFGDA
jgi:hypothetical protein